MIADLIEDLPRDPLRLENPFSSEMQACHEVLFRPGSTREDMALALDEWFASHQPCLFGRMEAKQHRIAYCLLNENDLERGDDHVRARIQGDRYLWKRRAMTGESHAFVILAISPRIANAAVCPALQKLAARLCSLYLGYDELDRIFVDDLLLEIKAESSIEYRIWPVGVNYFSAQGDGRWWRDHRIPGGIAFSMNSVGHMARTNAEKMLARNAELADNSRNVPRERLTYWALPLAMRTIGPPFDGSTRGTCLAARGQFAEDVEPPTFDQRQRVFETLATFSENRYLGYYHTDHTIPSPYFDTSITELTGATRRDDLYFTYLHAAKDRDYASMGIGTLIAAIDEERRSMQGEGADRP